MHSELLVPKYAFFIKGAGIYTDRLQAFDNALKSAGPLVHNLVGVSSILPAGCEIINKKKGLKMLTPGQITFCVIARSDSNTKGASPVAAIGMARFKNKNHYGFISEHHHENQNSLEAGAYAERLAREMFFRKLELQHDKQTEVETLHVVEGGTVGNDGKWVSVVALCVFVV